MNVISAEPGLSVSWSPPDEIDTDLLVIPVFERDDLADVMDLGPATGGALTRARESGEIQAKEYQIFATGITERRWRAHRLALIGAGNRDAFSTGVARRVAAAAAIWARQNGAPRVAFAPRLRDASAAFVQALAEGLVLAAFDPGSYKTANRDGVDLQDLTIVLGGAGGAVLKQAGDRGALLGRCSNLARVLANEPGNVLTPRVFAERAASFASGSSVAVEILDEHAIADLRMGLLLGVARGSAEPPRVIVLRYNPPGPVNTGPVLGLVGKGITFDSGGISIKPADGMERMKDDMSGGAAVLAAMLAIAQLEAPIRVIGVVPTTENMPGGRAIKPGDVLTGAGGTTVEIINTDAEGRLVLGDALWYAQRLGATHLVDVATLTGACVVALGKITSGLFGTPREWTEIVRATADRAGDHCWPLPVFEDYREQLRSDIADLINSAGRPAGAITGAMFLKTFTGETPWAHLDIAGTAWADEARPYMPKGPTGVAVRTLAELPFTADLWGKDWKGRTERP